MDEIDKTTEHRVRQKAKRNGFRITKSRAPPNLNNHGLFMLADERNHCVLGDRYDATIEEIEAYIDEQIALVLAREAA
jgi:hypothetical protein